MLQCSLCGHEREDGDDCPCCGWEAVELEPVAKVHPFNGFDLVVLMLAAALVAATVVLVMY